MLVGLTVGKVAWRQAGRRNVSGFQNLYNSLQVKLFELYYHCNVTTVLELHFSQLLSSKAYFKVCFEVQKIWLPLLHVNPYY